MKPIQHQPRKLDDDGEQMLKLAIALIGGNRNLIPFAVITVLDGYKGMEPVVNQSLRNHLSHVLSRKLRGALMQARERLRKTERERPAASLPIVLLPDEETVGAESS